MKENNYKWIRKYHKQIFEYIMQSYESKNTLKGHLSVLSGILKALDTQPRAQKRYSKMATELCMELQDESKNQELSQKRKEIFITLEDIIKRREQFRQLFEQDKANNKYNLSWVLLSLYTLQPPLRQDYVNMPIVSAIPKNKKENYLLNKNGKYFVIIRRDKVIKSHGPEQFELSNELNNVINESLRAFPRQYILSTQRDGTKPIQKQGFESLLRSCFSPQRVSVDILRSAYVTHFYSDPRMTLKMKEELARKMRHSAAVAQREYQKINVSGISQPDNLVVQRYVEAPPPIVVEKKPFNLKVWRKDYREKHKQEINQKARDEYKAKKDEILRRHVLWNLNTQNTAVPKQSTIDKYNLKYDENKKCWG